MQVMGVNGVSHHVVEDDLEGCAAVLQWLSYISPVLGGPAAALPTTDPIDRSIGYLPGPGVGGPSSASAQAAFCCHAPGTGLGTLTVCCLAQRTLGLL